MSKVMLNYRPNGRSELRIPLKRLLAGVEKDLLRPAWYDEDDYDNLPKPYSHSIIIRISTLNLRHHQPLIILA